MTSTNVYKTRLKQKRRPHVIDVTVTTLGPRNSILGSPPSHPAVTVAEGVRSIALVNARRMMVAEFRNSRSFATDMGEQALQDFLGEFRCMLVP